MNELLHYTIDYAQVLLHSLPATPPALQLLSPLYAHNIKITKSALGSDEKGKKKEWREKKSTASSTFTLLACCLSKKILISITITTETTNNSNSNKNNAKELPAKLLHNCRRTSGTQNKVLNEVGKSCSLCSAHTPHFLRTQRKCNKFLYKTTTKSLYVGVCVCVYVVDKENMKTRAKVIQAKNARLRLSIHLSLIGSRSREWAGVGWQVLVWAEKTFDFFSFFLTLQHFCIFNKLISCCRLPLQLLQMFYVCFLIFYAKFHFVLWIFDNLCR